MDNRKLMGKTFKSHYFDPSKNTKKINKQESLVDFYIFFTKDISNIAAFHTPFSYIHEYSQTTFHSEEIAFIQDILLHHKVVEVINDPNSEKEELFLALLEYFCFGEDFFLTINAQLTGGFGIISLFAEDYHEKSIFTLVEPEINRERFYCYEKEKES